MSASNSPNHPASAFTYRDPSPSTSTATTEGTSSSSNRSTSTDASSIYEKDFPRVRNAVLEQALESFFQNPGAMRDLQFADARLKSEDSRASTDITRRQLKVMEEITRQGRKRERKEALRQKRREEKEAVKKEQRTEVVPVQRPLPSGGVDWSSKIETQETDRTPVYIDTRPETETTFKLDHSIVTVREVSEATSDNPTPNKEDSLRRYEIRPVPGKGLGLTATTHIAQGEIIIAESPFLIVDHPPLRQQIRRRVASLAPEEQVLVRSFNPSLVGRYSSRLVDIVATNVIPLGGEPLAEDDDDIILLGDDGEPERIHLSGLFKSICRVNHACLPNSQWTWFTALNQLVLKALRPIRAGAEITACYLQDPALDHDERQYHLKDIWGFTCQCETCVLPPIARAARDERLQRYRDLRDEYVGEHNEDTWQRDGLVVCSSKIKEALRILEDGGPIEEEGECFASLFKLSVRWGDEVKAIREGKAWVRHMIKMGDEVGPVFRQQVAKPRHALGWGMFDDDRSGDESECDSEDDFEKTLLAQHAESGRSHSLPKASKREGKNSKRRRTG